MSLIENPVSQFTGQDGTRHRLGYVQSRNGGGPMLVDEWAGHGLRLLVMLATYADEGEAQADAVIREYRVDACLSRRPLSRRVEVDEITQSTDSFATASA
jgi:hypothetical protein